MAGFNADQNFDVMFEDDSILQKGKNLRIRLVENIDSEANNDLQKASIILPAATPKLEGETLHLDVAALNKPGDPTATIAIGKKRISTAPANNYMMGFSVATTKVDIEKSDFTEHNGEFAKTYIEKEDFDDDRQKFHQELRSVWIHKSIFQTDSISPPVPGNENIKRVSGNSSPLKYLVGGTTTFIQLNEISKRYFDRSLGDYETVVDWGCGCARVTRQFWEAGRSLGIPDPDKQNIIGVDIDALNIDWCKSNMADRGDYRLLSLEGFDFKEASVDCLYGISVMTHLTEYHQNLWLEEIARVVKPGGTVILTTHGEFSYYRHPRMLATAFVERFGFFDLAPDAAIGSYRDTYYRATYHARDYVKKNWSKFFNILDVIPVANAFHQDFIVMKRF